MVDKKRPMGWNEIKEKIKLFKENQNKWTALICKEETFVEGKIYYWRIIV